MPDTYALELQMPGYCSLTRAILTCLVLSMTGVRNSLAIEEGTTVNVTGNTCGTSIDLQKHHDLFLSYEGHYFYENSCDITLNNNEPYTEVCMEKLTTFASYSQCIRMFSGHSLDKTAYENWNSYACYLHSWCDDTNSLLMRFKTKTWDDNTTLVLKMYLKRDVTVDVTGNACGTSIDLQKDKNLFLSYEGHYFDEDICEITLNNNEPYTEVCMEKLTTFASYSQCIRMFSGHSLNKTAYRNWNTYACYMYIGYRWCDDTKSLLMRFKTKTWDDNTTLLLNIYLKRDYTYDINEDNWSSWGSSNSSYDDSEDEDVDNELEVTILFLYVLIVLIASACIGCTVYMKRNCKAAEQNESRRIAETNQLPTSDLAHNATYMQAERSPEILYPSAPPDYNTLVMQHEHNGTGFITSNVTTNSNPNVLSNSQSNLESQSNQDDASRVSGNITEPESRQPPPDYFEVITNLEDYTKST